MPIFGTIDQMSGFIENVTLKEVATIVSIIGKEKLNQEVEDKIYGDVFIGSDITDNFYEHTFGLRNSAEVDITPMKNPITGTELMLDFYLKPKDKYTSYYPIGSNLDVTDKIVGWLDQGHKGFYKKRAINYEAKNIFSGALKKVKKGGEFKKRVTDYMKRLGYKIGRSTSNS